MDKHKVIHAKIDCHKCHKICVQYLNEEPIVEVITLDNGTQVEYCIPCADQYHKNLS